MRTFDFSPLYRSSIGFDQLANLFDQTARSEPSAAWPPYNIEKVDEDAYRITLAVAGFAPNDIEIVQENGTLLIAGRKDEVDGERQFLHRGIAGRHFRQTFSLADYVKVTGASMENGMLVVDLAREVPEALKPRRIPIGGTSAAQGQDNTQIRLKERAQAA